MKPLFATSCAGRFSHALSIAVFALVVSACSSPVEQAEEYYERGMTLLQQGELEKARIEFQNALQIVNTMPGPMYGLALVAERQGEWEKSFGLLNKVVDQDPKHFEAQLKLGRMLLAAGQLDRALKNSDNLLVLRPNHPQAIALRAAVLLKLEDTKGAIAHANEALKLDPQSIDAMVVLASERLVAGDAEKAIEWLDRALAINERSVSLQLIKVQALEKLSRRDSAEEVFRKLINFYPENKPLRHVLAQFYLAHGSPDKAEAEYRAMVKERPDDIEAKLEVVRFLNGVRGPAAAAAELQTLIKADKSNSEYKFALAQIELNRKNTAAGEAVLQDIIKTADSSVALRAKGYLAASRLANNDRKTAETLIEEILSEDKSNEQGLFLRASISIEQRRVDAAISDLRTILRDSPSSARTLVLLGKAHELDESPELAEDQYVRALQGSRAAPPYAVAYAEFLMRRRQPARAEAVLQSSLAANPRNPQVIKMLAEVQLMQGDWVAAQELVQKLRQVGDQDRVSDQLQGAIYAGRKDYEASIGAFKRAYEAAPNEAQPVLALVRSYMAAGKTDEAVNFLQAVVQRNPNHTNARVLLGQLQLTKGNTDGAMQNFNAAIAQDPKNVAGHRALANAHLRDKRYAELEKTAQQGLAQVPNDVGLMMLLASGYELSSRRDEAIALYEKILVEQPNADIAANNLASLLSDRSDKASLNRAYELARRFERSDVPQFKDTLGWAAHKVGKHAQASEHLRKAAEKLPNEGVVRYHLGMTYVALSDKAGAKRELTKAVEIAAKNPFPQAEEARTALRNL